MIVSVNEVTAEGASVNHLSLSLDNDASHLYFQPFQLQPFAGRWLHPQGGTISWESDRTDHSSNPYT